MNTYGVYIPIAGYIYKEVEADNEKEAINILLDKGYEDEDIGELDMYPTLVEGNVCYARKTKAYAFKID